jgi:hypothetical protein
VPLIYLRLMWLVHVPLVLPTREMATVITFKPSCPLVPLFQQSGTTSRVRAQPLSCKADRQRSPRATFSQGTPRVSKAKATSSSARKRVIVPQAVVSAVPSLTRPPDVVGANWRKELRRRVSESFPEGIYTAVFPKRGLVNTTKETSKITCEKGYSCVLRAAFICGRQ